MNNLVFNLKRFLANKNTVTFIGVLLVVLIIYIGYNWRVGQALTAQQVPYAVVTIQPRTKITADMVGSVKIPPNLVMGQIIQNSVYVIGNYSNYNTIIPEGSLFYIDQVVTKELLPDSAFVDIPTGSTAFSLPVSIQTTYGNSIFPGNYINLYFKAINEDGKVMVGKLVENIKVLAVKDSSGKHVFENTETERTPSSIIFAVPEATHLMLRKAMYLAQNSDISGELIPVPNTATYTTTPGEVTITSQYLKAFIDANTGYVPEDELPDVTDNTTTQQTTETTDTTTAQ